MESDSREQQSKKDLKKTQNRRITAISGTPKAGVPADIMRDIR
jgi:hypothetical protein